MFITASGREVSDLGFCLVYCCPTMMHSVKELPFALSPSIRMDALMYAPNLS